MSDQVQPLNYSAHAIEDLLRTAADWQDMGAVRSAGALRDVIELLRMSVKFILPNCCNLIDPDDLRQAHLDLLRLPYSCVAFEAPWEKEEEGPKSVGEFEQAKANKRIALCWASDPALELLPGLNSILHVFPEGGVFVLPIYWGPDAKKWSVPLGGGFVPYENTVQRLSLDESMPATRIANQALIDAGQVKESALQFRAEPFVLLPELYEATLASYGSQEKVFAQIILDVHDEVMVLVQACSVLNCANVTTADIPPAAALNKKRQASGKQPFFTYKVLQVAEERRGGASSGNGGAHAMPRMHLRRGHLRHLESKTIWVRPTTVNAGTKLGTVAKDYALVSRV